MFCDIFRPQLCALLEHNVGQVGGLEEDLATHHYERISTAVTCGDEHRWPVVDSSEQQSHNPWHGAGAAAAGVWTRACGAMAASTARTEATRRGAARCGGGC